ncbi:hypothetical protein PENTCL1PPCAC_14429, partial [Pristionchus entomophagus]
MNESALWRMAHESDVFPYYFERTDLPYFRMSGFIQELWNSLARSHRKTMVLDSCADESTNLNELGLIGNECLKVMEEGSVVTLMEGASIDRSRIQAFKYQSLPIFSAQVQFYEVSTYTTDNPVSLNYFLLFSIPEWIAIIIAFVSYRLIRAKHNQSANIILRHFYGATMLIILVGLSLLACIYSAAFQDNTVLQTYTSTMKSNSQLDIIIGEDNRINHGYAASMGRVALLESVCSDPRHIAALYPMEVVEATNQNKIRCTLR